MLIVSGYQKALDHYRAAGCQLCRYSNLETDFLNDKSVIATASWDLLREDGSVISRRRHAAAELERVGAHYVVDSIADLMPVIDRIEGRLARGERP